VEARTYRPIRSRGGHKYLLQIMFGHHMFRMYLRNILTNVCILRRISLVTSNDSYSYESTDFTHKLHLRILVSFRVDADSRTSLSLQNDPLAFCILTLTSGLAPNSTSETTEI
jgi:hypothetical protein